MPELPFPAGLPMSRGLTKIVLAGLDERSRHPRRWDFVREHVREETIDVEQMRIHRGSATRAVTHTILHESSNDGTQPYSKDIAPIMRGRIP